MLVDLDHFKQINDQHPHDLDDGVLVEVSNLLERLALEHNALCGHRVVRSLRSFYQMLHGTKQ